MKTQYVRYKSQSIVATKFFEYFSYKGERILAMEVIIIIYAVIVRIFQLQKSKYLSSKVRIFLLQKAKYFSYKTQGGLATKFRIFQLKS